MIRLTSGEIKVPYDVVCPLDGQGISFLACMQRFSGFFQMLPVETVFSYKPCLIEDAADYDIKPLCVRDRLYKIVPSAETE